MGLAELQSAIRTRVSANLFSLLWAGKLEAKISVFLKIVKSCEVVRLCEVPLNEVPLQLYRPNFTG